MRVPFYRSKYLRSRDHGKGEIVRVDGRGIVGRSSSQSRSASLVFIANELGNFRHHREHLVRAAMAMGMKPILLAAPVGSNRGIDYDYWPIPIERFRFHPLLDPWLFVTVLRLLLKEKPQVAHLISLKPYLYGGLAARLARLFGWKGGVVFTVPGLGRLYDEVNTSLRARLRRAAVEFFLRIVTHDARVTFETEHDRDFWIARRLIAPEQAMVTRGAGIDLARFSNSHPRRWPDPIGWSGFNLSS